MPLSSLLAPRFVGALTLQDPPQSFMELGALPPLLHGQHCSVGDSNSLKILGIGAFLGGSAGQLTKLTSSQMRGSNPYSS